MSSGLVADGLQLAYDELVVASGLTLEIPEGKITTIVGANASGKSTLLRALARLLRPRRGTVLLDGKDVHRLPTREVARRLGILPQTPIAPEGITVADLVARGRTPHRGWTARHSAADVAAIEAAMAATSTTGLAARRVDELSGGQRQRAWIAMALAQETEILLLDEPTTYLDLAHELDVLDLLVDLNRDEGRTIVIVLHQLNHACRYGDHVVAMRDGSILAQGAPAEVVTEAVIADVFGIECRVIPDPVTGTPLVVPLGRHTTRPHDNHEKEEGT